MNYTETIFVEKRLYEDIENHLEKAIAFEDCPMDETIEAFSAKFPNKIIMDINVVNALTDYGGAWVDSVLFEDGNEVCCGEPWSSLDDFSLEHNGDIYTVVIKQKEG